MTKEKLALEIIERLKREYPDADCTLDYDQAWQAMAKPITSKADIAYKNLCIFSFFIKTTPCFYQSHYQKHFCEYKASRFRIHSDSFKA